MKHKPDCQPDGIRGFDSGVAKCAHNPVQAQQKGQQDDPWIQQAEVADVLGGDQVPVIQHADSHCIVKLCTLAAPSIQQAATVRQHAIQPGAADEGNDEDQVFDAGIDCQPEYCRCEDRVHAFIASCMCKDAQLADQKPVEQDYKRSGQQQQSRAGQPETTGASP
ncbi:hypothetical protein KDL30_14330 [bacterium]|nr:hypothetical protein [bacterium]